MTRWRLLLTLWLTLLAAWPAAAHEMSMAEMTMQETSPGEFVWHWTAGMRSGSDDVRPRWPEGCQAEGSTLRCTDGLAGTLAMDGVGKGFSAVLVKVNWLDGGLRVYTITTGQPQVRLYGSADDQRGMGEIARAYGLLGVEHILGGIDHLLFVIGLLFLVGFTRRLVLTITAFTVAHSLTLALSALGLLTLRPPPVEAVIALSIMLVASEALHQRSTMSRRWPALVALLFGLVHGLGFAGALEEIGLPENHLAVALLTFNLGVEVGQMVVVAGAGLLMFALRRLKLESAAWAAPARTVALYAIGGAAAYWTIERSAAIFA